MAYVAEIEDEIDKEEPEIELEDKRKTVKSISEHFGQGKGNKNETES